MLQHIWDGAQIRLEVRDLPANTEQLLRTDDCQIVANLAIERARELAGKESLSTSGIQSGFASAIADILKPEP